MVRLDVFCTSDKIFNRNDLHSFLYSNGVPGFFDPSMNTHGITLAKIIPLQLESIENSAATPDEVDKELLPFFEEEAHAELKAIEKLLHDMDDEKSTNPPDDLRRHFHTLKGAANSIGHLRIGVLSSGMEDVFKQLKTVQGAVLRPQVIKTSVIVLQAIRALMQEARQPQFNTVKKEQIIAAAGGILKLKEKVVELKGGK